MFRKISLFILVFLCVACAKSTAPASASIHVDMSEPVVISDGEIELTLDEMIEIQKKVLTDGTTYERTADTPDWLRLVEVKMTYENLTEKNMRLDQSRLIVGFDGDEEGYGEPIRLAFCEPSGSDPYGPAIWCAKIPQSKSGTYGVIGVFQTPGVEIEPGKVGKFTMVLAVPEDQMMLVLGFAEKPLE